MNEGRPQADDSGLTDALRAAIERTMAATAPAAGRTRERAAELVDELARRGQGAREELARRGQEAQAELTRQLDALEKRMASIEDLLRRDTSDTDQSKPKAEG